LTTSEPAEQVPAKLDVWLHVEHVGVLTNAGFGLVGLEFTEDTIIRHGAGSRLLSISLPLDRGPLEPRRATSFFRGLLPEGAALQRVAQKERLSDNDCFGLLERLGRDCAGALSIRPAGLDAERVEAAIRWLTAPQLKQLLINLPFNPLGLDDEGRVRLSLAGAQDKLVVCIDDDGVVGQPLDGHPSSHILKPPPTRVDGAGVVAFPDLVANEAFCMRLAALAGLSVAEVAVRHLDGLKMLVVTRFDRQMEDGKARRIHQEDSCQALNIDPMHKYQEHGGPGLTEIAELLRAYATSPIPDILKLLRLTIFNTLIGNADAHGKNFALLHLAEGLELAPAYDLVSTAVYPRGNPRLAMDIGPATDLSQVDRPALEAMFDACGVPSRLAQRTIADTCDAIVGALPAAIEVAKREGWNAPIVDQINDRVGSAAARIE
jgi:serine/threonine-protein kinase HipA